MVYVICIDFWFGFGLAFGCCVFLIWVRVTRLRMYKRTKCGVSLYLHSKHFYPFDILDTMTLEEKREIADKLDGIHGVDLMLEHLRNIDLMVDD